MKKSKWYVEDVAFKAIKDNLEAKQDFASNYYMREYPKFCCKMKNLHMDKHLTK